LKISKELHLISTVIFSLFAICTLSFGFFVITNVVYNFTTQLLESELESIIEDINSTHDILVQTGLDKVQKYVDSAKNEISLHYKNYGFRKTGKLTIIENEKVDIINGIFNLDYIESVKQSKSGKIEFDYFGEARFGVYQQFPLWNWTLLLSIEKDSMLAPRRRYLNVITLITIFTLIITSSLSFLFSKKIVDDIEDILGSVKKVENGNLSTTLEKSKTVDELFYLRKGINSMIRQIELRTKEISKSNEEKLRFKDELYESEIHQREAQIMALQSQINPHFLYNTLECISSFAAQYNAEEIENISISLSRIFRFAIKGDNIVTVADELLSVDNYLKIQKYRFLDKIETIIDIDENMRNQRMVKFIIQPLIENSIYHGLEPKLHKGTIYLTGAIFDRSMEFVIEDDGVGIPRKELVQLQHQLENKNNSDGDIDVGNRGIGLMNIHNRIIYAYGSDYGLKLTSKEGVGTTVNVILPLLMERTENV